MISIVKKMKNEIVLARDTIVQLCEDVARFRDIETLWVIGNGFDLACHLDTGYQAFLNEYTRLSEHDSSIVTSFKKEIALNTESWMSLESQLGRVCSHSIFNTPTGIGDYLECHEHLKKAIAAYMKRVDENYITRETKHFSYDKVRLYINENTIGSEKPAFIILNYTRNFENYIRNELKPVNPIFIYPHGTADNFLVGKEDIVLGVGSPFQIHNRKFRKDKTLRSKIIKVETNCYSKFEETSLLLPLGLPKEINIYGCSTGDMEKLDTLFGLKMRLCNSTDGYLWSLIFNSITHKLKFTDNITIKIHNRKAAKDNIIRTLQGGILPNSCIRLIKSNRLKIMYNSIDD